MEAVVPLVVEEAARADALAAVEAYSDAFVEEGAVRAA